jgi:TolB-like protein/DNA-binding winged helix-turn-helix (wHTH) protein
VDAQLVDLRAVPSTGEVVSSRPLEQIHVVANDDARCRFGVFDFDVKTLELQKHGRTLKVRPQSLTLLALLVTRRGELVTRDDIQLALWGRDTHVDFEQGVNHCIKELRAALGDAAESPRYIETVPRRGYRFIAAIEPATVSPVPVPPRATSPRRRFVATGAGLAVLLVALGTSAWWRPSRTEPASGAAVSIAALPLVNFSGDPADAYFADGVTDSLITELARTPNLLVIAPTAVFRYKDRAIDPRIAGQELGARYVLHGSVQRADARVRVNVRLMDVTTGREVLGEPFEDSARDVFRLQSRISARIAEALQVTLSNSAARGSGRRPTASEHAYDAYLQGMFYARHAGPGSPDRAIAFLEQAVQADPAFALAQAALGSLYMERFFYEDADPALEQKAVVAVDRALAADPDLAEGYLARAQLVWTLPNRFPHERAIRDLKRALSLNPSLAAAHRELGKIYLHVGLLEESIEANARADQLNPGDPGFVRRVLAHVYLRQCEAALQLIDGNAGVPSRGRRRAEVLRCLGRDDEALRELSTSPFPSLRAVLQARKGSHVESRRALQTAQPVAANADELSHVHHAQYFMGAAYALLGDTRQAVAWLKKASNEGLPCYPLYERDPDLSSVRTDPEFVALLQDLQAQRDRLRVTIGQMR